jgi:Histidine kinase
MFQIKYNNRKSFWLYSGLLFLVFLAFVYGVIYQLFALNESLSQRMARQKLENIEELFHHELHSFFQAGEQSMSIIQNQNDQLSVENKLQKLSLWYQSDEALENVSLHRYSLTGEHLGDTYYKKLNPKLIDLELNTKPEGLSLSTENGKDYLFWHESYQQNGQHYVLCFVFDLEKFKAHLKPILAHQESRVSLYLPNGECFYQSHHQQKTKDKLDVKRFDHQHSIQFNEVSGDILGLLSRLDDHGIYLKIESDKLLLDTELSSLKQYIWLLAIISLACLLGLFWLSERKLAKEENRNHRLRQEKQNLELVNEMQQKENALLQLQQLKNQINPHFLFNSLNSLHALILQNPDLSQEFVLKLANVYRYILNQKEIDHASVAQELDFVKEYYFLQKIRFAEALHLQIELENKSALQHKIPFLSLQSLIENAIKHNVISSNKKLEIIILVQAEQIVVSNRLQKRRTAPENSHKIGLSYLRNIYEFNQITGFSAAEVGENYVAVLPFLMEENQA